MAHGEAADLLIHMPADPFSADCVLRARSTAQLFKTSSGSDLEVASSSSPRDQSDRWGAAYSRNPAQIKSCLKLQGTNPDWVCISSPMTRFSYIGLVYYIRTQQLHQLMRRDKKNIRKSSNMAASFPVLCNSLIKD